MAAPVWVLSVDLQTKTAAFTSNMASAAKSARSAFQDIKSGASDMGGAVGTSTGAARQGVMLLAQEFGVHLPRGITTFVSSLGPVGAAMEAAFPFIAIAAGALILLQHLQSMHEAGVKLTQDQLNFGTSIQNAFNALDDKLLQAGIKADELRNDHLGALAKQLTLIDHASMAELAHSFEEVAKSADVVFADMESHWYTFGIGSAGAKHALDTFKGQYESLLAQGKGAEAADLLKGTRESAEHVLAMQKQAKAALGGMSGSSGTDVADQVRLTQAQNELKKAGVGWDEKEVASQQALIGVLQAQGTIQSKIADLKALQSANASRSTAGQMSAEQSAAAKAAAESKSRIAEQGLQADRATENARLTAQRASIAERLASELAFADREYALQQAGNARQIAALDKLAKDYPNALRALHEKAEELTAEHATKVAEITAKGATEQAAKDLSDLQQSERAKIEATDQGSAARLAAIDSAIREEQAKNLQDTSFYRELLTQRVEVARKAAEEEAKQAAEAGRLVAEQSEKMGALQLAAEREHQALIDSARRMTAQLRAKEEEEFANQEFALKRAEAAQEMAALDKSGNDYANKLRELQNKEKQLIQQHENEVAAIHDKAQMEQNQNQMAAMTRLEQMTASGLTQVLMGHKSFASQMNSIGDQIVFGMLRTALMSMMTADMGKEKQAASAARTMYLAGAKFPFPANIVMAPAMGAMAFASVMAFQDGTDSVPGIGKGDRVPAMLEPGEGVVPGGVMDSLRNMARSGNMGGGNHLHLHGVSFAPTVHALDSDGVDKVLSKHSDKFQKHIESAFRKMNR